MGDQPSNATPQPALDFVDNSSLQYFIPRDTVFAPNQVFKDGSASFEQLVNSIEKRESLFFGKPA